jgi:hypothetical protein
MKNENGWVTTEDKSLALSYSDDTVKTHILIAQKVFLRDEYIQMSINKKQLLELIHELENEQ